MPNFSDAEAEPAAGAQATLLRLFTDASGTLTVVGTSDGEKTLRLEPGHGRRPWILGTSTHRPIPYIDVLVQQRTAEGALNELYRERLIEAKLQSLLAVFPQITGSGIRRILDFGCGAGASAIVLADLFPEASVLGVDVDENSVAAARERSQALSREQIRFLASLDHPDLPKDDESVDLLLLNAVFEHLLPRERREILPALWRYVRPGGLLLVVETPHRWFPVEVHTTRLPLLNYLPDRLALLAVRHFSPVFTRDVPWHSVLRAGTRGATVREILSCVAGVAGPEPDVLRSPIAGMDAQAELWWHGDFRRSRAKRGVLGVLRALRRTTGLDWTPWITLVLRKPDGSSA